MFRRKANIDLLNDLKSYYENDILKYYEKTRDKATNNSGSKINETFKENKVTATISNEDSNSILLTNK